MQSNFRHIAEEIRRQIETSLSKVGILCRVFARGKDQDSLDTKLNREPTKYSMGGKMLQDAVGVRVALYFSEDIPIVKLLLEAKYRIDLPSSTIDTPNSDQFSVTRFNLIFKIPNETVKDFKQAALNAPIDTTFEVQLRSILSEGWHEVEHDLRYKVKENWESHDDLSRALNGIVATIETSEWSMGRIFDELAYRHYKQNNWTGMLANLLRMRLTGNISEELTHALSNDAAAAKDLLRIDRSSLIQSLSKALPPVPVTMDNLVCFWNAIGPKHQSLTNLSKQLTLDSANSLST